MVGIKYTKKSLEVQGDCASDGGVQFRHGKSIDEIVMGLDHRKGVNRDIKLDLSASYGAGSEVRT